MIWYQRMEFLWCDCVIGIFVSYIYIYIYMFILLAHPICLCLVMIVYAVHGSRWCCKWIWWPREGAAIDQEKRVFQSFYVLWFLNKIVIFSIIKLDIVIEFYIIMDWGFSWWRNKFWISRCFGNYNYIKWGVNIISILFYYKFVIFERNVTHES